LIVPRDAATIMLVREAADGMEVLMLRRNLASGWVGGMHLFPGGAVDDSDAAPELFARSHDLDDDEASQLLGVATGGLAFFVAAIRECFEEAGLLLALSRDGAPVDISSANGTAERYREHRRRLNVGEATFSALCAQEDLLLDTGRLHYFSHWITPEGQPRRYDTRFFVAEAPPGQSALHDDIEVIDSLWISPAEALRRHASREIEMMLPTMKNLEAISRFGSAAELLAAAGSAAVPTVTPRVRVEDGAMRILMPGDEGYDEPPSSAAQSPGGPEGGQA
jgi:8-oxo-dGTP pyrophosphatase MutT (NUDIX family)